MKKKGIFVAIISLAVFFLAGCGQEKGLEKQSVDQSKASNQKEVAKDDDSATGLFSGKTSLKDLMGMDKNMECTWMGKDEDGKEISGKVSVSGKKFRMVMTGKDPKTGADTKWNNINDGTWVYTWTDSDKNSGIKMKSSDVDGSENDLPDVSNRGNVTDNGKEAEKEATLETDYDYDCKPWSALDADFSVPSDVKFTDMSEMMKNLQSQLPAQPE